MTQASTSSAPVTSPPTARGRATRQALLDAAEEVFGQLSFDRASVSEITRRAGVAQGTFYVYFPDKKAAFTELVRHLNHSLRETIAKAVAGHSDRREIERIGFRTFFDYVRDHRALYLIVREAEFVDPDIYRWHYDTLAEGYVTGLDDAKAAGQLSGDIDERSMKSLADNMRRDLLTYPDISAATVVGAREYEIGIEISQAQLRAHGLTRDDIAALLRQSAVEVPGGGLKTDA